MKVLGSKMKKIVNQLQRVGYNKENLPKDKLREMYLGALQPLITYRCVTWEEESKVIHNQRKLRSYQRLCVVKWYKVFCSTSTYAVLVSLGIVPIDLQIRRQCARYKIRKGECVNIEKLRIGRETEK